MKRFKLVRYLNHDPECGPLTLCWGVECSRGGTQPGPVLTYWPAEETTGTYPSMDVFRKVHVQGSVYHQGVIWIDE